MGQWRVHRKISHLTHIRVESQWFQAFPFSRVGRNETKHNHFYNHTKFSDRKMFFQRLKELRSGKCSSQKSIAEITGCSRHRKTRRYIHKHKFLTFYEPVNTNVEISCIQLENNAYSFIRNNNTFNKISLFIE